MIDAEVGDVSFMVCLSPRRVVELAWGGCAHCHGMVELAWGGRWLYPLSWCGGA